MSPPEPVASILRAAGIDPSEVQEFELTWCEYDVQPSISVKMRPTIGAINITLVRD